MTTKREPREEVGAEAGLGGFGKDFAPQDREFQAIRMKARDVMDGRATYTNAELSRIIARLLIER